MRALADSASKILGQPVIVENKPGAGGAIAVQALQGAPADGHTVLFGFGSLAGLPLLQKSPPFRSLDELAPVSIVGRHSLGIFVSPAVPANSVADLITYGRANPDKLSYGTGTLAEYMAAVQFCKATGIRAVRVPYKGISQLMPDLLSGRIQFNIGPVQGGLQHVKAGKLRMLAIVAPQRSALAPDVPTLAETGVGAVSLPTWQAIFAPARTPGEIADRLSQEVASVLRMPSLREQFDQQGLQVEGSTPDALAAAVAQAQQSWAAFVRENDIPAE
jgi:tripartite-type tricarboxylate transporter receptor subunit TctC